MLVFFAILKLQICLILIAFEKAPIYGNLKYTFYCY